MKQKTDEKRTIFPRAMAFCVHVLTAAGALCALFGFVAVANGRWDVMFLWLGIAFVVDGIDGPIARKLDIRNNIPRWSGEYLDVVVDYSTYVLLPAFFIAQGDLLFPPANLIAASLIVITGAIYYALKETKTKDNHFIGFPVVWNMLVFEMLVFEFSEIAVLSTILFFCIATFIPINFNHPVRVIKFRNFNLAMTFLWLSSAILIGINDLKAVGLIAVVHALSGLYLLVIGGVLQLLCRITHKKPNQTGEQDV